ncbi:MAG: PQQ-binding-like beta-propeller repeat protein [bacterium]|nr:PQQ-binding-like beta-propeller repeat protein [bacterium]
MINVFVLLLLQQTYATGTWPKSGATLENTHLQFMKGAMSGTPTIKWSYRQPNSEGLESECTVADVNNDDTMEVVLGNQGEIFWLNGETGMLRGTYGTFMSADYSYSSPALGDVDGDFKMEIVTIKNNSSYEVVCLDGNSSALKWQHTCGSFMGASIYCPSPAIADVDKDGSMEVILGYCDSVYCFYGNSGLVKWSYSGGGNTVFCAMPSPAIADIDNDDTIEIVISAINDSVTCLNGVTGEKKWNRSISPGAFEVNWSAPAIADVDKDANMEVVVGGIDGNVYCLNGANSAIKWTYQTMGEIWSSPTLVDVNKDDTMEVVIGSNDLNVYCLNGVNGKVKWTYYKSNTYYIHRAITSADIDGDNKIELFVPSCNNGTPNSVVCLNGEDGSVLWTAPTPSHDIHDITIADIDNDGCVELVFVVYDTSVANNKVYALDDIGNAKNCGCMGTEEKLNIKNQKSKLKIIKGKIYLDVPNTINANIKLYDLSGRVREVIHTGVLDKGNYTFTPNFNKNGIYFVKVTVGNYQETKKLILIK